MRIWNSASATPVCTWPSCQGESSPTACTPSCRRDVKVHFKNELSSVQVPKNQSNCWNYVNLVQFLYIKISEKLEPSSVQVPKNGLNCRNLVHWTKFLHNPACRSAACSQSPAPYLLNPVRTACLTGTHICGTAFPGNSLRPPLCAHLYAMGCGIPVLSQRTPLCNL